MFISNCLLACSLLFCLLAESINHTLTISVCSLLAYLHVSSSAPAYMFTSLSAYSLVDFVTYMFAVMLVATNCAAHKRRGK